MKLKSWIEASISTQLQKVGYDQAQCNLDEGLVYYAYDIDVDEWGYSYAWTALTVTKAIRIIIINLLNKNYGKDKEILCQKGKES